MALLLAFSVITAYTTNICLGAASAPVKKSSNSSIVNAAVAKYKQKNYTGAIQDLSPYLLEDGAKYNDKNNKLKNDALAYYYLGISYAQIGYTSEARTAYNKVIEFNDDDRLVKYATRAIACLDGQPQCSPNYVDEKDIVQDDDMTAFIKSGKFLHDDVKTETQGKALDKIKDQINNDTPPDVKNYKYLNDASGALNAQPTDKEIADAVRVLAKVGVNPFI